MNSLFAMVCVLVLVLREARTEPFLNSPLPLQVKKSVLCRCYVACVDQLKQEGLYVKTRDMSLGNLHATRCSTAFGQIIHPAIPAA